MGDFSFKSLGEKITMRLSNSLGWDRERSSQVAEIVEDVIRSEHGGARHYIPKETQRVKALVRAEFNGRNVTELSVKYGRSCSTIRRYVKKCHS